MFGIIKHLYMKNIAIGTLIVIISFNALAQTPASIIAGVKKAQQSIKLVSYTMKRTDTLVTGDIRSMTGSVTMKPDVNDKIFGFLFRAQLTGDTEERVYDGNMGYIINNSKKTYSSTANQDNIRQLTWGGGGWFIMSDLVKIDTAKAIDLDLKQDDRYYYLTIRYADYKPEHVIKRYKILTINKTTFLPVALRNHQETLGKIQDLYYQINEIYINNAALNYDFLLPFLKDYSLAINTKAAPPAVFNLMGKDAPDFFLNSFANSITPVTLSDYKGKVVLMDFWEVWCGPCVASMPKVQHLYDMYKSKGLQVLGIINDIRQLEPSRLMLKDKNYSFPMLVGDMQLRKDYKFDGTVPLYILVNKLGQISFIGQGYSAEMETAIKKAVE
jgi:thiol-disulfide isomerase/thioredoxin